LPPGATRSSVIFNNFHCVPHRKKLKRLSMASEPTQGVVARGVAKANCAFGGHQAEGEPHGGRHTRCGASTYTFEKTELKTWRAGINEASALSTKNSHKRRGFTLRQTPHQFMEALERTNTLVDIIRQPSPFSAGPRERLEHRLEHLISEQQEEEEETASRKIKTLQLEGKVLARIHKIDGMHFYCIDFPQRAQPCALHIEVWSATDSSAIRFYVSRSDVPTPSSFDWWSPTNSRLTIAPDDPRFQHGTYWITIAALGSNARYRLVCNSHMQRPVFSTVHKKAAEKMVKKGVMDYLKASQSRMMDSRNSSKPLRPAYREQYRPLSSPAAPSTGGDVDGRTADRRPCVTISRTQSLFCQEHAGGGSNREVGGAATRKPSTESASSWSSNAEPKPAKTLTKEEKETITLQRCDHFEQKYLKATLEPFSLRSRSVSVKDSHFNPEKLRQALALIHEVSSADHDNKNKYENGKVQVKDLCSEFASRSFRHSIENATRSTAHRLGASVASDAHSQAQLPGSPQHQSSLSEQRQHGHQKSRTQAQWALSTEDPRLRKMIGREGLPRRMCMLKRDAIDYRTHSFAEGYFRLSRVGALEMTGDEAGAHEQNKDVPFKHLAQIQELISATEITLPDQPSTFHCFRLEFPDATKDTDFFSTKGSGKIFLTLAAFSPEERSKWLEALNLFAELTAAERERAAKRAAFKRQQKHSKQHLLAQQLSLDKPDAAASSVRSSGVGLGGAGGSGPRFLGDGSLSPSGAQTGPPATLRETPQGASAASTAAATRRGMHAPEHAQPPWSAEGGGGESGAAAESPGTGVDMADSFSLVYAFSQTSSPSRVRPMSAVPWRTADSPPPKNVVRPTSALR